MSRSCFFLLFSPILLASLTSPVCSHAQTDTTWFGGTTWNADSLRWEAVSDSVWTFDTGVASHFQHTDPFKNPALHALMEGWVGSDRTFKLEGQHFKRLSQNDPDWGSSVCVGSVAGLEGDFSMWAGTLEPDAQSLCWVSGQGYGNGWRTIIQRDFNYTGGTLDIAYDYVCEMESGFDYTYFEFRESPTANWVEQASHTGSTSGQQMVPLITVSQAPAQMSVRFRVESDNAYSDEDGLSGTACGAFAFDEFTFTTTSTLVQDFEGGIQGWSYAPQEGGVGDFSDLVPFMDVSSDTCSAVDSVLIVPNPAYGTNEYDNTVALSPWLDLEGAGLVGSDVFLLEFAFGYGDNTTGALDFQVAPVGVQWYPDTTCNGELVESDLVRITGGPLFEGDPGCTGPTMMRRQVDLSDIVPAHATRFRVYLGSECWPFDPCSAANFYWYDFVRLGVEVEGSVSVPDIRPTPIPLQLAPNPIRRGHGTTVRFELDEPSKVRIDVFDLSGRRVGAIYRGFTARGSTSFNWTPTLADGRPVAAGIYFVKLTTPKETQNQKLVVIE